MIPFPWHGGKFIHLKWLLPLLPQAHTYCEPFGGSGVVLLNRPPSKVEVYNDLDRNVWNFFKVLRDCRDDLIQQIALTPFSRIEMAMSEQAETVVDPVEQARRFYVRARQSRAGLGQSATARTWGFTVSHSRSGMAGRVSAWLNSIDALPEIAERLMRVQIEFDPALGVIERFDTSDTLFYCDPPYPAESRKSKNVYAHEMSDDDHVALADVLHNVEGKVAISGYRCDLMDRLYHDWLLHEDATRHAPAAHMPRTEALWMNYGPPSRQAQLWEEQL